MRAGQVRGRLRKAMPSASPRCVSLSRLSLARCLPLFRRALHASCMSPPPSLLHLTLATAVLHIHRLSDLSAVPDHLVLHLFHQTLAQGKLTDHVLRMFLAAGNDEVLQLVKALRIRPVIKPILPTREFCFTPVAAVHFRVRAIFPRFLNLHLSTGVRRQNYSIFQLNPSRLFGEEILVQGID